MSRSWNLAIFVFASFFLSAQALLNKWEATNFCKCICFQSNYSILHLSLPDTPSQPCLSCTKQWCLNQNLPICAGASLGLDEVNPDTANGKEGDVEARCFQRNSPKDQIFVTIYLLIVFGLLLGAGIKNRMEKAGFDVGSTWNNGAAWWEHFRARMPTEEFGLSRLGNRPLDRNNRSGRRDYVPVSDEA